MELCNDITRITLIDAYNEGIYVFFLVFYVAFYFILWLNTFLSSWSRRRSNNITGFGCDIWLFVLLFVTLGCCSCSCKSNTFLNKWTELYIFIEILYFRCVQNWYCHMAVYCDVFLLWQIERDRYWTITQQLVEEIRKHNMYALK